MVPVVLAAMPGLAVLVVLVVDVPELGVLGLT
jgi:hypothetical protein